MTLYDDLQDLTMIPREIFDSNLELAGTIRDLPGTVVECGVWRGGMIAAIASTLGPARRYHLFDSFEGLPPARPIDGRAALAWQADTTSPIYHDNCRAERSFAEDAMRSVGVDDYRIWPGWFHQTIPNYADGPIALLRLDGDWYGSTMTCLQYLFQRVSSGGLVIIDDYGTWEGCTLAVHRYLAEYRRAEPIRTTAAGVAYLVKA